MLPLYQLLNILSSIPLPPPSPPRDRCRYHFSQSQFPSAFVIPAHIYELSIAVSGCKITDVLWGGIGWDYLGLSINAYSLSLSFLCHYSLINLKALWGCNVFVGGGGSAVGADGVGGLGDRSSSYIIKHYTLGRTRYQGLSDCVSSALWQGRRHDNSTQDKKGLLSVVHKSTLQLN